MGDTTTLDSTASSLTDQPSRSLLEIIVIEIFLILIVVVTVCGNLLVCVTVLTDRRLRTATNCFILSLAFTDLLLGSTVLPISAFTAVHPSWPLGPVTCNIYVSLDVMFCTASILILFAISLDRYFAVTHPMRYHQSSRGSLVWKINAGIWLFSAVVAFVPIHLGWNTQDGAVQNTRPLVNEGVIIHHGLYRDQQDFDITGASEEEIGFDRIIGTQLHNTHDAETSTLNTHLNLSTNNSNIMYNNSNRPTSITADNNQKGNFTEMYFTGSTPYIFNESLIHNQETNTGNYNNNNHQSISDDALSAAANEKTPLRDDSANSNTRGNEILNRSTINNRNQPNAAKVSRVELAGNTGTTSITSRYGAPGTITSAVMDDRVSNVNNGSKNIHKSILHNNVLLKDTQNMMTSSIFAQGTSSYSISPSLHCIFELNKPYTLSIALGTYFAPLAIMCMVYFKILRISLVQARAINGLNLKISCSGGLNHLLGDSYVMGESIADVINTTEDIRDVEILGRTRNKTAENSSETEILKTSNTVAKNTPKSKITFVNKFRQKFMRKKNQSAANASKTTVENYKFSQKKEEGKSPRNNIRYQNCRQNGAELKGCVCELKGSVHEIIDDCNQNTARTQAALPVSADQSRCHGDDISGHLAVNKYCDPVTEEQEQDHHGGVSPEGVNTEVPNSQAVEINERKINDIRTESPQDVNTVGDQRIENEQKINDLQTPNMSLNSLNTAVLSETGLYKCPGDVTITSDLSQYATSPVDARSSQISLSLPGQITPPSVSVTSALRKPGVTTPLDAQSTGSVPRRWLPYPRRANSSRDSKVVSERKATVTLAILVAAFAVCWIPYFVLFILKPFIGYPYKPVNEHLDLFVLWLGYFNSSINPFLYAFYSSSFRDGFRRVLSKYCCCFRHAKF